VTRLKKPLSEKLNKSSPELQNQIILALGNSGSKKTAGLNSKKAAGALIRKLRDKDPRTSKVCSRSPW